MNDPDDELIDMPGYMPKLNKHQDIDAQKKANHYYSYESAKRLEGILKRWKENCNFKACATIDAGRAQMTHETLYQLIIHGRSYALKEFNESNEWLAHMRAFKVKKFPKTNTVMLVYIHEDTYIAKTIEDAMEFGEQQVDIQQLFHDWYESDPPDGATFPNKDLILSADDVDFFRKLQEKMIEFSTPRRGFVVKLDGQKVFIRSIKQEDMV